MYLISPILTFLQLISPVYIHTNGTYTAFNAFKLPLSNEMDLFGASVRENLLSVAHGQLVSVTLNSHYDSCSRCANFFNSVITSANILEFCFWPMISILFANLGTYKLFCVVRSLFISRC